MGGAAGNDLSSLPRQDSTRVRLPERHRNSAKESAPFRSQDGMARRWHCTPRARWAACQRERPPREAAGVHGTDTCSASTPRLVRPLGAESRSGIGSRQILLRVSTTMVGWRVSGLAWEPPKQTPADKSGGRSIKRVHLASTRRVRRTWRRVNVRIGPCPERDSNPHALSSMHLLGARVYQFHHPGTWTEMAGTGGATKQVSPRYPTAG